MPKHIPVPIKSVSEPWGRVELENGAIVTFRVVLNQVYQVFNDDGKPLINENGDLLFGINSQTLVGIERAPVERKEMN